MRVCSHQLLKLPYRRDGRLAVTPRWRSFRQRFLGPISQAMERSTMGRCMRHAEHHAVVGGDPGDVVRAGDGSGGFVDMEVIDGETRPRRPAVAAAV